MMRNALGQLRSAGQHAHTSYSGAVEANQKNLGLDHVRYESPWVNRCG